MKFEGGGLEKGVGSPSGGSFENWPERGSSKDERLSSEEALLYQEYATKVAGKKFNEQADNTAYQEAEEVIKKLNDAKFDWLGIDWGKIDTKDIDKISETEQRIDFIVRQLVSNGEDHNGMLADLVNKFKHGCIPIMAALAVLSVGEFPTDAMAESAMVYKQERMREGGIKIVVDEVREPKGSGSRGTHYFEMYVNVKSSVQKWLSENPDIAKEVDTIVIETAVNNPENILKDITLYNEQEKISPDKSTLTKFDSATNSLGLSSKPKFKGELWRGSAHPDKVVVVTKDREVFSDSGIVAGYFARIGSQRGSVMEITNQLYGESVYNALNKIADQIQYKKKYDKK